MTPQSTFTIVAPIVPARRAALAELLATMTDKPGMAAPHNRVVPFAAFGGLHFARFVILDDITVADVAAYGATAPDLPTYLAFLGDCDGPADRLIDALVAEAAPGLRQIFAHCEGFSETVDLGRWLRAHAVPAATLYTNRQGRTVRQTREEIALHAALRRCLAATEGSNDAASSARERCHRLRAAVRGEGVTLTPPAATPLGWQLAKAASFVAGLMIASIALPFLVVAAPVTLFILRQREKRDPVIAPRPAPEQVRALARLEDHDVPNGFTAVGSLKPGLFRKAVMVLALAGLQFTTRHLYTRGRLARVGTIHFARWVLLDGKRRMLFASNYDGGLETYMDDFINKAGFGLNLVFGNGTGYPRTSLLLGGGAHEEQQFKNFLRRHQVPTDVWYKAYPGLTNVDLARNAELRGGFEREDLSDAEARRWLSLI